MPGPLQVAEAAPVLGVVAAVVGVRAEFRADVVRREESSAAAPAVDEGRLNRCLEIVLCRHVDDRIVDKHRIELSADSQGAHVALDVFALRVYRAAQIEHPGRDISERYLEVGFHVESVVPTATAQLED